MRRLGDQRLLASQQAELHHKQIAVLQQQKAAATLDEDQWQAQRQHQQLAASAAAAKAKHRAEPGMNRDDKKPIASSKHRGAGPLQLPKTPRQKANPQYAGYPDATGTGSGQI